MKSWLNVSKSNVHEFFTKMDILWKQQHNQYQHMMATASLQVSPTRMTPFWAAVNRRIHAYPLQQAFQQWEQRHNNTSCTGSFTATSGLPCRHTISRLIECHQILQVTHFHQHWWIDRNGLTEDQNIVILPPKSLKDLRADRAAMTSHQKGAGVNGNRRIPFSFELPAKSIELIHQPDTDIELPNILDSVTNKRHKSTHGSRCRTLESRKLQIRGRVGTHWCTLTSHAFINNKLWFWVTWDYVENGEPNPTQQDEQDLLAVGMSAVVARYKRAHNL